MIILIGFTLSISRKKGCFGFWCTGKEIEKFKDGIEKGFSLIGFTNYSPDFDKEISEKILLAIKKNKSEKGIPKLKKLLEEPITVWKKDFTEQNVISLKNHLKPILSSIYKTYDPNKPHILKKYYDECHKEVKEEEYNFAGTVCAKVIVIIIDMSL